MYGSIVLRDRISRTTQSEGKVISKLEVGAWVLWSQFITSVQVKSTYAGYGKQVALPN